MTDTTQRQTPEQPQQAPAPDSMAKKPRRVLTLEEREEKARAQASRAAQRLARVKADIRKQELHRKACVGEIVITLAAKDKGAILDAILNGAAAKGVPIDDHHMQIIQSLYPA